MDFIKFQNNQWAKKKSVVLPFHSIASKMISEEPILDIGGGDGTFALRLKERGFNKVTVVDISPVAVEKAREKGLEARVLDVSQTPLPFGDMSFGTITMTEVLEHFYDPLPILKECARIGRKIILSIPNFHYFRCRLEMFFGIVPFQCRPGRWGHVYWFNYKILLRMLEEAGLEIEQKVFIIPLKFLPKSLWYSLARVLPDLFAIGYVVKCRKKNK